MFRTDASIEKVEDIDIHQGAIAIYLFPWEVEE